MDIMLSAPFTSLDSCILFYLGQVICGALKNKLILDFFLLFIVFVVGGLSANNPTYH